MERMMMLSSAYRCQKVMCMTLRVAIPLSLVLGILMGVLITMDTDNPISPSLPVVYLHEMDHGNIMEQKAETRSGVNRNWSLVNTTTSGSNGTANVTIDPLLIGLPLLKPFGEQVMRMNLSELRIYIYPLPKGFNKNLADCAVRNARSGMCFDITNNGKGSLLRSDFGHGYSVYNTHQFSLETIFHHRLLQSEYVTWEPEEADLFYVPYYVCMRCFCPAQDGAVMNTEFWQLLLSNYTYLQQGRPHFMALGKVEQEMSSKHCPFLQGPNVHLMKYLLIEQTASSSIRRYFGRLKHESELVVVPYPSYIHFDRPLAVIGDQHQTAMEIQGSSPKQREHHHGNRTLLALMVGSMKKSPLRMRLAEQLRNSSVGHAYVIPPSECWLSANNIPVRIFKLMRKAIFCLQPPGDTETRKSFFDAVLTGCIPIVFRSKVVYPFMDIFNYTSFSLFIPEDTFMGHNHSIISILESVPRERIQSMQEMLGKIAVHLQYGSYRHGQDAFTLALKKLVHKFNIDKFIDNDMELIGKSNLEQPER